MSDSSILIEGSIKNPVQQDPFQMIVNVHWSDLPVVYVEVSTGADTVFYQVDNQGTIVFNQAPSNGEIVIFNDVNLVAGTDFKGNTANAAAADLAAVLNKSPKPVDAITSASAFNNTVSVRPNPDLILRMGSKGSSMVVTGESFVEFPPLTAGTIIDTNKYGGLSLYDPFGNNGLFIEDSEIFYYVYVYITGSDPPAFRISNVYGNRTRRSALFNMAVCPKGIVGVQGRVGDAFFEAPPLIAGYIERQWISSPSYMTFTAYPSNTRFKLNNDGTMSPQDGAKSIWKFSKTADPDVLLNPYLLITFDKNGEVK